MLNVIERSLLVAATYAILPLKPWLNLLTMTSAIGTVSECPLQKFHALDVTNRPVTLIDKQSEPKTSLHTSAVAVLLISVAAGLG